MPSKTPPGATASANEEPVVKLGTKVSEVILSKITVSNLRSSLDFYTKIVGLKEVQMPSSIPKPVFDDPDVVFTEVGLNFSGSPADPYLCLVKQKGLRPDPELAKLTWVGFKVPDTQAAVARAKAAGFTVVNEATQVLGMVFGLLRDPDGYLVEFFEAQSFGR